MGLRSYFHKQKVSTAGHLKSLPAGAASGLTLTTVHAAHTGFVWITLQRLGVRESDLEDIHQEVFLVVHKRLDTFDGSCDIKTWLFAICVRVVSTHRRSAYVRRESPVDTLPDSPSPEATASPERAAQVNEARRSAEAILDRMDLRRRVIFVMYEIEGLSCVEIAESLGLPIGTVYSRLNVAREEFEDAVKRMKARNQRGGES